MIEDSLSSYAHAHHAGRIREAEIYRLMVDSAPLHFGEGAFARPRRAVAAILSRLADAISP